MTKVIVKGGVMQFFDGKNSGDHKRLIYGDHRNAGIF